MRLALEALGVAQPQPTIVDTLIDQLKLIDAEDALRDSLEEMDVLIHTYQSLESIHQAIKTCGVTQSIVHLYGENFSSMESDQPGDAEKEVEEKKQGLLARIWTAIKDMFKKFIEWLGSLFESVNRIKARLKETISNADKCNYPFPAIVLSLQVMNNIGQYIGNIGDKVFTNPKEVLDKNYASIRRDLESDLGKDNERNVPSSQVLVHACENHITFFDDLVKLKKKLENDLHTLIGQNKIAKDMGLSMDGVVSGYRDAIVLCKDIIKANITSSKNLITAANKAQNQQ